MKPSIVQVKNLWVYYPQEKKEKMTAVRNISFTLNPGESVGVIGESASGKSSVAMALMGLLKKRAEVRGEILYGDEELNRMSEQKWNSYRWKRLAMVFQNSLEVLNPVLTVGEQIGEAIRRHTPVDGEAVRARVEELLDMVGLDGIWIKSYPHQLSGGMRQKVLIAMALSCDPEVLLVDEPTTALDAASKKEMVELLQRLHEERGFSMLVISHEIPVIMRLTSRLMVMYAGNIVEEGKNGEVLKDPLHPYTRGLVEASPVVNPYRDLWGIPGESGIVKEGQCPFYERCNQRIEQCTGEHPELKNISGERKVACVRGGIVTLLEGKSLSKSYQVKGKCIEACKDCHLSVKAGETVLLIGESGSGKTTVAEILAGILEAEKGEVLFEGKRISGSRETARKGGIQIVFQDPLSATNEQFTIEEAVREPLDILKLESREHRQETVRQALKDVQLPQEDFFLSRRCHMLSGGQRQRIAIARSLVLEPRLLIADEISSMLDPSTQANILRLLKGLQNQKGFAMLYITHDLALARKIADRVYVMHRGRIIEKGTAKDVLTNPQENYTKKLLQSAVL